MGKTLAILFCLFGNILLAQSSLTEIKRNIFQDLNSSVNQNYIRLINESMVGDFDNKYYAFSDWVSFRVESQEGDIITIDSANYHIHDDIMLFIKDGSLYYLFPDQIDRIYTQDRVYTSYIYDGKNFAYYEILEEGKLQLLKKSRIVKEKAMNHPMGLTHGAVEYNFKEKAEFYYFDVYKEKLKLVPRKKKELIKIFTKNKSKMLAYARDNRLNSKSEDDLKKLFYYYNNMN